LAGIFPGLGFDGQKAGAISQLPDILSTNIF
jgi:hypothetical protein